MQNGADIRFEVITTGFLHFLLRFILRLKVPILSDRVVQDMLHAHFDFHPAQCPFLFLEMFEDGQHLVPDRLIRFETTVLCEITDFDILAFHDVTRVMTEFTSDDFEQGRFTGTVSSDERNPISLLYFQFDIL